MLSRHRLSGEVAMDRVPRWVPHHPFLREMIERSATRLSSPQTSGRGSYRNLSPVSFFCRNRLALVLRIGSRERRDRGSTRHPMQT